MNTFFFLVLALGLAAFSLAAHAAATEEKALRLTPKEAIATTLPQRQAPFLASQHEEPKLDFVPHPESRRGSPSSCKAERTLCYDPTNGHIVYKPARQLMPDLPGLQRENISVRRDRVIFRYSF
jgi:hypothetical protein